jgi:uncharacterized protein YwqG
MMSVKVVVIGLGLATLICFLAYRFLAYARFLTMHSHVIGFDKSYANFREVEARMKKWKQFAAESRPYFADGPTPAAEDVVRLYRELGQDDVANAMEARLRPCVHLIAQDGSSKPTRSRIGGLPDLPSGEAWPKNEGRSMAFIAQLDLADLPDAARGLALPDHGMLFFFYDEEEGTGAWGCGPEDRGCWAVRYVEEVFPAVLRQEYPSDLWTPAHYTGVPVGFEVGSSLPSPEGILRELPLSEKDKYQVEDVYEQYRELVDRKAMHQLLGYPDPVQGDHMALECQLASNGVYCGNADWHEDPRYSALQAGASEWRMLLQVDSDARAEMMWGDCGRLYFWIRQADLEQRNFDDVWMILQCG